MLLKFWHTSITRIRPATKVVRGSTVFDWDNPSTLVINECLVQPGTTNLSMDGRVLGIQDGLTVCAPEDADIQAGDRIEYRGEVYTINGDPLVWVDAGKLNHMQLNLQRWRG